MLSICFVQSLFVLGSSVWPKNSFLKTFVSVTIIVLIYVLVGMLWGICYLAEAVKIMVIFFQ